MPRTRTTLRCIHCFRNRCIPNVDLGSVSMAPESPLHLFLGPPYNTGGGSSDLTETITVLLIESSGDIIRDFSVSSGSFGSVALTSRYWKRSITCNHQILIALKYLSKNLLTMGV
ncbi:hypothetical protein PAXRUDRAFT_409886 [Paxillus rubicundulus Ve08.2h10]|uniref:Uncharacterized protein n=1 Tax=Paxillus rubicundulus Ve08.2h10 TaxID=930991 RepID=A0A0D0E8M3_9AGAM|nr:hypothetical protein PAXRUDRAFT_409886 [Paxillus rubicundulus Ve08.2h10]